MSLSQDAVLNASGTGNVKGKGYTETIKDKAIQGASYAGQGGTTSNEYVKYYGTYQGKLTMEYTELIGYLVNPILSNDLKPEFYDKIQDYLGSGGGVNNTNVHANGGGAIVLRS